MQMDAKLPINTFEDVMQLATEGCKAIAAYIREVRIHFAPSSLQSNSSFIQEIKYKIL